MARRFVFGASLMILGFALGLATPRPTGSPSPATPPLRIPASGPADQGPPRDACKSQLSSTRTHLAICLAYRTSPEPSAPTPPPCPTAIMPGETQGEETARLVRASTEAVLVRRPDGSTRVYGPGEWPPPGGPGIGSHLIARKLPGDGGMEWRSPDGGAETRTIFPPELLRALDGGAPRPGSGSEGEREARP